MKPNQEKEAFMAVYKQKPEIQDLLFAAQVDPSMRSNIMNFISYMGEVEYQYSKMNRNRQIN